MRLYFFSAAKEIESSSAGYVPLFTLLVYALFLRARHPSFYALLKYLEEELVRVEKRAMSLICPGLPYQEAIELVNIVPIVDLCSKVQQTLHCT